jgi:hypothetical protein
MRPQSFWHLPTVAGPSRGAVREDSSHQCVNHSYCLFLVRSNIHRGAKPLLNSAVGCAADWRHKPFYDLIYLIG